MKHMHLFLRRTVFTVLVLSLMVTGLISGNVQAKSANEGFVYYISNDDLFRVGTDGSPSQKLHSEFSGVGFESTHDYIYYTYDWKSTTLLRLSVSDLQAQPVNYSGDKKIVYYETFDNLLYFMDDQGGIYRASSSNQKASEATLIANMADTDYPMFTVKNGRLYYNAIKAGDTSWVASKSADGSGQVQWIASGVFEDSYQVSSNLTTVSIMVNTEPKELNYSIDCMVLYTLPINGGSVEAVNLKSPLDSNAVNAGEWINEYYLYNKGIELDYENDEDYDYTTGKGYLFKKDGTSIRLHKTSIDEIASIGTNKYVFIDGYGKAYVTTIVNSKVTTTKKLKLSDVYYVRNLISKDKVKATVLFAEDGVYMLNENLSFKKIIGAEWDKFSYEDDIPGIFYVNAEDNDRMYYVSEDGKTTVKLADEQVSTIMLITEP
ncbi:hypothetical protein J2T13_004775 [Paenibacillus sp. DS2015]|uniref:DUF5050 domain-containing protein n=1 Tax=Paenibacillus sp. DS2015 TaxID=3373917 RepID=UPI003D1B0DB4